MADWPAIAPFRVGQAVRYRPGFGTYGYEDALEADGKIPGVVVGFTRTRVRVELALRGRGRLRRSVAVESLTPVVENSEAPGQTYHTSAAPLRT